MFLKGRGDQLLKKLRDKMALQAAERQYEAAARTRDQVFAVQRVLERQRISSPQTAERDVFAVYRERDRMAIQVLAVRDGEVSDGESFVFRNVVLESAEHLASFAPFVPRTMKAMVHAGMEGSLAAALMLEKYAQGALVQTDDKHEGISAFLAKRDPQFKGR